VHDAAAKRPMSGRHTNRDPSPFGLQAAALVADRH
jgi:hypothetical protein